MCFINPANEGTKRMQTVAENSKIKNFEEKINFRWNCFKTVTEFNMFSKRMPEIHFV